jgi:hypothetical protein
MKDLEQPVAEGQRVSYTGSRRFRESAGLALEK